MWLPRLPYHVNRRQSRYSAASFFAFLITRKGIIVPGGLEFVHILFFMLLRLIVASHMHAEA